MAVANAVHRYAGDEVQVFPAFTVPNMSTASLYKKHILAAEGESQWNFFTGNFQEYEEDKKRRLGEEGAKPKRIRYKPITR